MKLDQPVVGWEDCVLGDYDTPTGGIVALPHGADRLDVGLSIKQTEWGFDCDPGHVTIRPVYARLFTLRDAWEYRQIAMMGDENVGEPPEDWFPDEGVPSWEFTTSDRGQEVWEVRCA